MFKVGLVSSYIWIIKAKITGLVDQNVILSCKHRTNYAQGIISLARFRASGKVSPASSVFIMKMNALMLFCPVSPTAIFFIVFSSRLSALLCALLRRRRILDHDSQRESCGFSVLPLSLLAQRQGSDRGLNA